MEKEVQTKRRIVDGAIDFHNDPWSKMPNGALEPVSTPAVVAYTFSTVRLPDPLRSLILCSQPKDL
jgi:hypothetical protein